jgi:hypothetical protein
MPYNDLVRNFIFLNISIQFISIWKSIIYSKCHRLFFYIYIYSNILILLLVLYDIDLYNCTCLNKSLATTIFSNKLRRISSSAMTDSVTDFDITTHSDNDETKRVKFDYKRYKLIKVSIHISKFSFIICFHRLVQWFW